MAARVTAALWALSPLAIANALNGLETALALAVQLALVEIWWSARQASDDNRSAAAATRRYVAAGLLAGLAMLARIDSVFLVGLLGMWEFSARRWKPLFTAAGVAALVVAPWWMYCTVRFGSPIPESGQAVRDIVAFHRSIHLTHAKAMGWAAGTLLASPFADTARVRDALLEAPRGGVAAWLAMVGLGVGAGWRFLRGASRAFGLHALVVCLFYTFTLPALWFFRRYLVSAEALLAILWGVVAASAWERARRPQGRALVAAASALLVSVGAAASLPWLTQEPAGSVDRGLHGAKAYREAAQEIFTAIPRGAVVGALQSGALSYYRPEGIEVINLDGVVDSHAREAARHHRLADYARSRGVTHIADWPFNLAAFLAMSSQTNVTRENLMRIAVVRPQGDDSFLVLKITWPGDPTSSGALRGETIETF